MLDPRSYTERYGGELVLNKIMCDEEGTGYTTLDGRRLAPRMTKIVKNRLRDVWDLSASEAE